MEISLRDLAKRYNKEWIFKGLNYHFSSGNSYALIGSNGSGKSTLLKILSAYNLPSEGTIEYRHLDKAIPDDEIYKYISVATPYLELIEDFTLQEHIDFHFKFRKMRQGYNTERIIDSCLLSQSKDKQIKNFSSGMKQRLKLALACYTESEIVLLDEPTSNLDNQGITWYKAQISELVKTDSILIIASNQDYEYEKFCSEHIDLLKYKR